MAKKNNEQYPSYHLHLTFKSISFAALIGFGGYSVYPGSSNGEEIRRLDEQFIVATNDKIKLLEIEIASIRKDVVIVTALFAKDRRELIEEETER